MKRLFQSLGTLTRQDKTPSPASYANEMEESEPPLAPGFQWKNPSEPFRRLTKATILLFALSRHLTTSLPSTTIPTLLHNPQNNIPRLLHTALLPRYLNRLARRPRLRNLHITPRLLLNTINLASSRSNNASIPPRIRQDEVTRPARLLRPLQ